MTPTRACITVFACLLIWSGCRFNEESARGVADRFVDQHYVQINLAGAKPFCAGPALNKLAKEQSLTEGQTIDDTTRKPSVKYRLLEEHEGPDTTTFLFEGTISVPDSDQFRRKWIITTRKIDNDWKVSNFEETE